MYLVLVLAVAAVVGSFLTVATEDENGTEWLKRKRSRCPNCLHELKATNLIPVFSFIFQKGKCRYCGKKIPVRHLWIELSTVAVFAITFFALRGSPIQEIVIVLAMMTFLLALTITDLRFQTLPDSFLIILAILGVLKIFVFQNPIFLDAVLGALLGVFVFGLIVALSKGKAMGLGDVKLAGVMGIIFGWKVLIFALFIAFVVGGLWGLILMLAKKVTPKTQIPFGPFLAVGTALLLLFPGLFNIFLLLLGLR